MLLLLLGHKHPSGKIIYVMRGDALGSAQVLFDLYNEFSKGSVNAELTIPNLTKAI